MDQILQSHFLNLYSIALADAQIEAKELEALYKIGQEKGIEPSAIDEIILHPDKVKFIFPDTLEEKIIYLYDFAKIVLADGVIDKNERVTLELFCSRFGFEEENVHAIADFLIAAAKDNMGLNDLLQFINENLN
jgi:uncharacterized tellurite resistance protein B-like protein